MKRSMGAKKHILITSAWFPSDRTTNGIFVKEQAEALCRSGHRVTVLIATQLSLKAWLHGLWTKNKTEYDRSELLKVIHAKVIFPFPARLFRNPASSVKQYVVNRVLAKIDAYCSVHGRPQVIHHHCLSDNSYLAEAISRALGIPYVLTEHSNYFTYAQLNRFNWFETFEDHRRFVKKASERIAVSEIRARAYEKIFGASFVCIPNLVIDLFASPRAERPPNQPFTFICIAVLDHRKRQDILIKAFAQAFRNQPVRLVLVGNGILENEYRSLVAGLGIERQVVFKGKRDRCEVLALLDESHVAVLSSDQETFGIVLAEAMFRGIPVISTRSGGPEEVVTPESGLLVPKGDENALAESMKQMVMHHARYDTERIRTSAVRRFSEDVIVGRLERLYDRVCSSGAVRSDMDRSATTIDT